MALDNIQSGNTLDVTEQLVKFVSGQYDVTLVRTLPLMHLGIRGLGDVFRLCTSLMRLDLSGNQLTSLSGIEGAESLARINVSSNLLTSIEPLAALSKLEVLHVEGNRISDVSFTRHLEGLQHLRALYVCSYDGKLSNPVCASMPSYGAQIMAQLPRLRCLDGHFFLQADLRPQRVDAGDDDELVLPPAEPWLPDNYFNTKIFDAGQRVGVAAEMQFKAAVQECRAVLEKPVTL